MEVRHRAKNESEAMRKLWSENINGTTHDVYRDDEGHKVYEPPLSTEEVLLRTARDPLFAEELATGQIARCMTDDVAMGGLRTVSDMMHHDPAMTARICKAAEAQGYTPKPTDAYLHTVAAQEGDPAAFINHGQGRGQLRRVLESRGYQTKHGIGSDDLVPIEKVRDPESDPFEKPVHKLHPRIKNRIKKRMVNDNPELKRANQDELDHSIVEAHNHN